MRLIKICYQHQNFLSFTYWKTIYPRLDSLNFLFNINFFIESINLKDSLKFLENFRSLAVDPRSLRGLKVVKQLAGMAYPLGCSLKQWPA